MTKKLYYKDSYQKEGQAQILQVKEEAGKILVLLDQTIFYPEGGGQPSDRGTINGISILDVQEKEGLIYHQMESAPEPGPAQLAIDWARRFDYMQQHSGEHILSGLFHSLYGLANKGFHLGEEIVTIDIDAKSLTQAQLDQVEDLANQAIYEGREVWEDTTDQEGQASFGARKQIQSEEDIRLVTIAGTDICPCCGTHVKNAAEIGLIKILRADAHKGMTRISLLCGQRALRDYQKKHEIISQLKQLLHSDEEGLVERNQKIQEELAQTRYQLKEQKNLQAENLAQDLTGKKEYRIFPDLDSDQLDHLIKVKQADKEVLVLASESQLKLLAYARDLDMGKTFKEGLRDFGGKGGGRGPLAQAKFDQLEDLRGFFNYLKEL